MPKISALPLASPPGVGDLLVLDQGLITKQITFNTLQSAVANAGTVQNLIFQAASLGSVAASVNFTQLAAGAITRPLQQRAKDWINVFDFFTQAQIADVIGRTASLNVSSALQAAIDFAHLVGAILFFPAGTYWVGSTTIIFKNNVIYRGSGKSITLGTCILSDAIGDNVQINNPINGSTSAECAIEDMWIKSTVLTAGKGCFADTGSSFVSIKRVGASGNDFQFIFDQTELANVDEPDAELSNPLSTGGFWLVSGADRTPGGSAQFTNRITIKNAQINSAGTGIGIVDDGGISHHYSDINFNALGTDMRVANVNSFVLDGSSECEGEITTSIHFAATRLNGTAVSATTTAILLGTQFSNGLAIPFITYDMGALLNQIILGNTFINNNAGGAPTSGIENVTNNLGFGNVQSGTGDATNTKLGNFIGGSGAAGGNVSLRVGSRTLSASERALWNDESPVTRYYVGDGSGFSVAFSKRTGSVTTDLVTFNDSGTVANFSGNVSLSGALNPSGRIFPGKFDGTAQSSAALLAGSGLPSNSNGNNGDFYFRFDGGLGSNIFKKTLGSWLTLI